MLCSALLCSALLVVLMCLFSRAAEKIPQFIRFSLGIERDARTKCDSIFLLAYANSLAHNTIPKKRKKACIPLSKPSRAVVISAEMCMHSRYNAIEFTHSEYARAK